MSEWFQRDLTYPNAAYNCVQMCISFAAGIGASYYPVDGGFKLDRHRANAKLYASESEIRHVLLKRLLKQVRKVEQEIHLALTETTNIEVERRREQG